MATYTAEGWQTLNLDTSMRRSGNNPYQGSEYADNFPLRKTDYDEEWGKIDREYRRQVSVKVKDGKVIQVDKQKCNDGSEWKCKTIKGDEGEINKQLDDWASSRGFSWNGNKSPLKDLGKNLKDNYAKNEEAKAKRAENAKANADNEAWNTGSGEDQRLGLMQAAADSANAAGDKIYTKNDALNKWSDAAVKWAKATPSGKYMQNREKILNSNPGGQSEYLVSLEENGVITGAERETLIFGGPIGSTLDPSGNVKGNGGLIGSYRTYYAKERVTPWDNKTQGINPPVGGFDSTYYLNENEGNQNLKEKWSAAEKPYNIYTSLGDDLDITVRYGDVGNYAWNNYSVLGKSAGYRGNRPEDTVNTDAYEENWNKNFTDAERQNIRDNQLGLTGTRVSDGQTIRTVNWEDATGGTLEKIVGKEILQEELVEQDRFKGLGLDMMQATIDELNKAKARERELDVYKGLPGFSEIFNINSSLSNSILGDSGVGGLLGMMGTNTSELQENFEDQLSNVTGINFGNAEYNWQKWYNDTLIKNLKEQSSTKGFGVSYNEETGEVEIGDERTTVYQLEEDFKKNFIDNYVKPRFDESKSMDEFLSYIDTIDKETEQNIFQTQSSVNALRDIAALRAEAFYADLESGSGYDTKTFNADFYADPTQSKYGKVNEDKTLRYQEQKKGFEDDWAAAKANPNAIAYSMTEQEAADFGLTGGKRSVTWGELAYYYGLDLNDKTSFAKLHYDNIGRGRGYDPARDVVTDSDVEDFVNNNVLSAVRDANVEFGDSPFLAFVTPAEFADEILEGIDPLENKEEWQKVLEMYGLDETTASLDEVKEIIIDSVRTGAAKEIREGIKYLNQKRKKPTQKRLGVEYIERDEDFKPTDDPDADALFKTFQNAGYAGTQEEFYETFMPDADRSDLNLITQGLGGLTLDVGDMSDPFEALGALGGFLGDGDEDVFGNKPEDKPEQEPSYFDLFADERDYDKDYASDTGRGFIDDFTSFFK